MYLIVIPIYYDFILMNVVNFHKGVFLRNQYVFKELISKTYIISPCIVVNHISYLSWQIKVVCQDKEDNKSLYKFNNHTS